MAKGRSKKCVICNEPIVDEVGIPYKNRYAHEKCFNIVVKTLQKNKTEKITQASDEKGRARLTRPKAELKDGASEEEYKQKQEYYSYLRKLLGEQELSAKIYVVSDDYIRRYGFTFATMYQTLVYLNEIVGKELNGDVVGIIPYHYSEAMRYMESIDKVAEFSQHADVTNMYKAKVIQIKPKKQATRQIDVESV